MALNYVTLTFTEQDASDATVSGSVVIQATSVVTAAGIAVVGQQPVVRALGASPTSVQVVACDNTGTTPAAGFWAYSILLPGAAAPGLYLVNFANGSSQRFDSLTQVIAETTYGPAASAGTLTGALVPAVVELTDAATIALNAALGNVFAVTLGGNRTLGAPTNPADGQAIRVRVIQDGTGSRTLAYDAVYDFGTAGSPTLSTAAGKVDVLGFEYDAALAKWVYLGSGLGF